MAISMSDATVDTSVRDKLLSSTVGGLEAGVTANTAYGEDSEGYYTEHATGRSLAGITADFAQSVTNAIEEYITNVQNEINALEDSDSTIAFQGDQIRSALKAFIVSVRNVATSYLNKLSIAEHQIINSVQKVYQQQDTDLNANLSSDAGNLSSQSAS